MATTTNEPIAQTTLPDGSVRIASAGHSVLLTKLAPGRVLVVESGSQTPTARVALMKLVEDEIAHAAPIVVFIDLRGGARLDGEGRDAWGAFGKRNRSSIRRVVVLVRSKLLEMAFSVMSMFVGGGMIRATADEREFEGEIRLEVPAFRGLSTAPTDARG